MKQLSYRDPLTYIKFCLIMHLVIFVKLILNKVYSFIIRNANTQLPKTKLMNMSILISFIRSLSEAVDSEQYSWYRVERNYSFKCPYQALCALNIKFIFEIILKLWRKVNNELIVMTLYFWTLCKGYIMNMWDSSKQLHFLK